MRLGTTLIVVLAALLAGSPLAASSEKGEVTIVAVEPDLLVPLVADAVLSVSVEYRIRDFKRKRFYLSPQFTISDTETSSSGVESAKREYLTSASGRAVVECSLAKVYSDTSILRPLQLRIFLLEEESAESSRSVALS